MIEIIPETHTLASINPHTLFIELNSATRGEIEAAQAGGGTSRAWEVYEHESRHWRDMVTTVWGRQYLDQLFRTYDLILKTPNSKLETAYPVILDQFDSDRSILFPAYYKYVLPDARRIAAGERWSMGFSTGEKVATNGELDSRQPFIFVGFEAGGARIARQPVTVGSLIEARAMAAEVATVMAWGALRPAGEDVVALILKEQELKAQFYDPEFTTYSVAGHVVAMGARTPGMRQALLLSDKLADIALNLTPAGFSGMTPTKELGHPGDARLRGFRKSQNRGYAFCCIAFALGSDRGAGDIGREEIERALKIAGLPGIGKIYADSRAVMDAVPGRAAVDARLAEIRLKLLAAGSSLHQEPDFNASTATLQPSGASPAPLVGDQDCEVFSLGAAPISEADNEYLHDCRDEYRRVLRSALRAARGLDFEFTDFVY